MRRFPNSRIHPHFGAERLADRSAQTGIGYRHLSALGGRRTPFPRPPAQTGSGAKAGFRGFADYALGSEFRAGAGELLAEADGRRIAILCSEAVWWRCHRRIIADYLLAAGAEVVHILSASPQRAGAPDSGAAPQPDGTIHYPDPDLP